MKPINPLMKVYGSKWSSSRHYPKPIEGMPIYEPFSGGAGYSCRYHWHDVYIYDINPMLSELWQWIINEATTTDVLDIPLGVPAGTDITTLGLKRGQQLLLKYWQRTNNCSPTMTISPWGSSPGQWVASTRARVAEEIHAVKHWKFGPFSWIDSSPGTWIIDPPYQYNYKYGVKDFNYQGLAACVNQLPVESLVIACEAVCPKTQTVPDYLPFEFSHSQVTSRRKQSQSHHSKELVYVRKPVDSGQIIV